MAMKSYDTGSHSPKLYAMSIPVCYCRPGYFKLESIIAHPHTSCTSRY